MNEKWLKQNKLDTTDVKICENTKLNKFEWK